jgi:hypothetical protein
VSYWEPKQRGYEDPRDFKSSNQRSIHFKGIPEQFIHTDGLRYELFETVHAGPFGITLADHLKTSQARYPSRLLIATEASEKCQFLQPGCIGHLYVQADTPIVFGWDMSRERDE